jgi:hypothetical protein
MSPLIGAPAHEVPWRARLADERTNVLRAEGENKVSQKAPLTLFGATTLAFVIAVSGAGLQALSRPMDAASATVADATRYVQQFEKDFAVVISDENCTQHVRGSDPPIAPDYPVPSSIADRSLQSEMLFMWVPEDRQWLSVRNVLAVDGKPISGNAEMLELALKSPRAERDSTLRRLAELSARFNLGSVRRTFNNPTLALQFLDSGYRSRFRFSVKGPARDRADASSGLVKIDFAERQRPTVIQDRGKDLPSTGTLWVRPSDGVIVRTLLSVVGTDTTPASTITVEYRPDDRLKMWVPSRMEERYRVIHLADNAGSMLRDQTRFEEIDSVARYSNFRRFETSGRIIQPNR